MSADDWLDYVLLGLEVAFEHGEIDYRRFKEVQDETVRVYKLLKENNGNSPI